MYAGWWEFPGGKLEAMETVEEAAKREMREELGIDLQNSSPWVTLVHDYPHARDNPLVSFPHLIGRLPYWKRANPFKNGF